MGSRIPTHASRNDTQRSLAVAMSLELLGDGLNDCIGLAPKARDRKARHGSAGKVDGTWRIDFPTFSFISSLVPRYVENSFRWSCTQNCGHTSMVSVQTTRFRYWPRAGRVITCTSSRHCLPMWRHARQYRYLRRTRPDGSESTEWNFHGRKDMVRSVSARLCATQSCGISSRRPNITGSAVTMTSFWQC